MDFALNDEQQMLKALVERFANDRFETSRRPMHQTPDDGFTADNWRLLAEIGLLALPFSETSGGLDGGSVEITTVMEAMGRGLVAEPYMSSILLAGRLLEQAGTEDQKSAWVAPIIAGAAHLALACAEPTGRFSLEIVTTRATVNAAGDRVLTGLKTFVLAGRATDAYIVSARGPGDDIGLYLVAADAVGLIRKSYRLMDGATAQELVLDAVLGQKMAGGLTELRAVVDEGRLVACAEMLGVMSTLFDVTLDYLKTRRQFGAAIGSFQALQHRMADLYAVLEQSRSIVLRATLASATERPAAIAAAKSHVSRAAVLLAEDAVQMHGGMGVSDELIVGHGLKRILILASLFGDADSELRRYMAISRATA